ncbi:alpha-L-fucosidase C-terminal domain-containing protein [Pedobacter sp. AW1-32]|uniref:alpha-L-fucosidase C-terminal domain-containing protein n=1 Tax=Pedobacter sp. AW1-32 TaxID=3383026 RepID=UPI003FF037AF
MRFCTKGEILFATIMGWPEDGSVTITSLATDSEYYPNKITNVQLVATGQQLKFERTSKGLKVFLPTQSNSVSYANPLRIT